MDSSTGSISFQTHHMQSNEILQASLLDIIFEHRNKNYGAYVLRKEYNHRLLISMGLALSLLALLLFAVLINNKEHKIMPVGKKKDSVIVRVFNAPKEKI